MAINKDVAAIENALDEFVRISEEIGRTAEQIEKVKEEQYIAISKGICDPTYQYQIDNLTCYRDELETHRSRTRTDIYKKFENYYTGAK